MFSYIHLKTAVGLSNAGAVGDSSSTPISKVRCVHQQIPDPLSKERRLPSGIKSRENAMIPYRLSYTDALLSLIHSNTKDPILASSIPTILLVTHARTEPRIAKRHYPQSYSPVLQSTLCHPRSIRNIPFTYTDTMIIVERTIGSDSNRPFHRWETPCETPPSPSTRPRKTPA